MVWISSMVAVLVIMVQAYKLAQWDERYQEKLEEAEHHHREHMNTVNMLIESDKLNKELQFEQIKLKNKLEELH